MGEDPSGHLLIWDLFDFTQPNNHQFYFATQAVLVSDLLVNFLCFVYTWGFSGGRLGVLIQRMELYTENTNIVVDACRNKIPMD